MTDLASLSDRLRDLERKTEDWRHKHGTHISRIEGVLEERTRTLERGIMEQQQANLRLERRFDEFAKDVRSSIADMQRNMQGELKHISEQLSDHRTDASVISTKVGLVWAAVTALVASVGTLVFVKGVA